MSASIDILDVDDAVIVIHIDSSWIKVNSVKLAPVYWQRASDNPYRLVLVVKTAYGKSDDADSDGDRLFVLCTPVDIEGLRAIFSLALDAEGRET